MLATRQHGRPFASLVAFVACDDLGHIYFVTPKTTRKFANLTANPCVSVIINNSNKENGI